ncbi:MAG: flagellar biosynthesis regulator FlaF [Pseudomonadota bacterium]
MPALAQLQNGYLSATRNIGTPREVEYQLLSRVTGKLKKAASGKAEFKDLAAALHENLMIWQTLALDVVEDDNGLPSQLRAQIFYLYEFALVHTPKVLQREADASALIDVNTAVISGLRQAALAKGPDQCQV